MSKLIFLDVDGTLVDYDGKLPSSAARAIREAREAGNLVFLCTGRSLTEVPEELRAIGIDGVIGGGGTYILDGDDMIYDEPLSEKDARDVVDWLHERGREFFLETNNGLFGSEHFEEAALPAAIAYRKGQQASAPAHDVEAEYAFPPMVAAMGGGISSDENITVRSTFPRMVFGSELYRDNVNKVSFLLSGPEDVEAAKARFPYLRVATWGGKGESALFAEVAPGGIDKKTAIERLVAHRGADMRDTIGFGDAAPDIPMLEACEVGVAMGNGGEQIREMADMVAGDVDEDGLYNAFRELGLLGHREET